ncbi:hypothetical protein F170042I7_25840 [Blautia caecimuris]
MNKSAEKVKLTSFDDLFGTASLDSGERVTTVPLSQLHTFKEHPFRVADDEKMQETVESIKQYGVLMPGIVRPYPAGGYEVIAGHRRWRACELAGLSEMPVIIREMDDDTATVIMVDTNIQREDILPSEKAYAYKMKYEALKHQGSKGKNTAVLVGETAGDSGRTVQRYIRLQELKQLIGCPVPEQRIPTANYLKNNERSIMERKINETAAITVYPNGYALYEADGSATVFPVHPCGDYCYGFPPYVCTVSARLFEKEAWYIRLILEGEDRLFRNLETKEQNHTVSYHFVAEDWQELADAEDSVFDCVIQREMIRNVLGCLTGRQRRVMEAYAVEGKTMKEVAKELGITVTAVSWLLIRGRQRILREYPSLDRKGQ